MEHWTRAEMDRRAAALAEQALQAWPWFGPPIVEADREPVEPDDDHARDVTGTIPRDLIIRGRALSVRSWADVAKGTAGFIAGLGDETFDRVASELPKNLNRDATAFRRTS